MVNFHLEQTGRTAYCGASLKWARNANVRKWRRQQNVRMSTTVNEGSVTSLAEDEEVLPVPAPVCRLVQQVDSCQDVGIFECPFLGKGKAGECPVHD